MNEELAALQNQLYKVLEQISKHPMVEVVNIVSNRPIEKGYKDMDDRMGEFVQTEPTTTIVRIEYKMPK